MTDNTLQEHKEHILEASPGVRKAADALIAEIGRHDSGIEGKRETLAQACVYLLDSRYAPPLSGIDVEIHARLREAFWQFDGRPYRDGLTRLDPNAWYVALAFLTTYRKMIAKD